MCVAPWVVLDAFHKVFPSGSSDEIYGTYPTLVACATMSDGDLSRMTISSSNVLASSWVGQWQIGTSFVEMVIDGSLQVS